MGTQLEWCRLIEVRCCCQPVKQYGWLHVHESLVVKGRRVTFAGANDLRVTLEVRELQEDRAELVRLEGDPVDVTVVRCSRLALSSEHVPLETIAQLDGFVPWRPAFTCLRCHAVSFNVHDIAQRYCGRCHRFLEDDAGLET
jgi:hypothetical protein